MEKQLRFKCTKENPWKKEYGDYACHEDAKCIYSDDYYDKYECPHCKLTFKTELPDY